jgi:hypothetical protein
MTRRCGGHGLGITTRKAAESHAVRAEEFGATASYQHDTDWLFTDSGSDRWRVRCSDFGDDRHRPPPLVGSRRSNATRADSAAVPVARLRSSSAMWLNRSRHAAALRARSHVAAVCPLRSADLRLDNRRESGVPSQDRDERDDIDQHQRRRNRSGVAHRQHVRRCVLTPRSDAITATRRCTEDHLCQSITKQRRCENPLAPASHRCSSHS